MTANAASSSLLRPHSREQMPPPPSRRVAIPQAPASVMSVSSSSTGVMKHINNKGAPFQSLDRFVVVDDNNDDLHQNDTSSSSSSMDQQHSLLNTTADTDLILAAWKKEREEHQQLQRHNSQHSIGTSPSSNVQGRQQARFNGISVLTTDEDDEMVSSSVKGRPVVTTTAAAAAATTHLLSFDADESIISHASDFMPSSTIITSIHASDFTAGAGRMAPLVTPRIAQQHQQQQPQRSGTADVHAEEGGSFLNRPMNPHSSNFSVQSSSCGDDLSSSRTSPPSFSRRRNVTATPTTAKNMIDHKPAILQQRDETIHKLTLELGQWKAQHESLSQMQQQHQILTESIGRCTEELDDTTNQNELVLPYNPPVVGTIYHHRAPVHLRLAEDAMSLLPQPLLKT